MCISVSMTDGLREAERTFQSSNKRLVIKPNYTKHNYIYFTCLVRFDELFNTAFEITMNTNSSLTFLIQ